MLLCSVKCLKCNTIIFSRNVHDFRSCPCGAISIDGGFDYTKISGNADDYETIILDLKLDGNVTEMFGKSWTVKDALNFDYNAADFGLESCLGMIAPDKVNTYIYKSLGNGVLAMRYPFDEKEIVPEFEIEYAEKEKNIKSKRLRYLVDTILEKG